MFLFTAYISPHCSAPLRVIQHTAVSWSAESTFSCNFFTARQLPHFVLQSCSSSTLRTSDACRASYRPCICEQEWKEGSRGGRAPLLVAKSCYAWLVCCWIISLGHHNYHFLHGVTPTAVSFDCSIALLLAWLLSKERQLCKDRKMRKGLRDFKLAEHSVLTLDMSTCVDTQSSVALKSSGTS